MERGPAKEEKNTLINKLQNILLSSQQRECSDYKIRPEYVIYIRYFFYSRCRGLLQHEKVSNSEPLPVVWLRLKKTEYSAFPWGRSFGVLKDSQILKRSW